MILKFILNMLIEVISFLFQMISGMLPNVDFVRYYKVFFQIIADVIEFAVNFLYFLFGEALFPIIGFATMFLIFRYVGFPIIVIIRRIFIKGGDT